MLWRSLALNCMYNCKVRCESMSAMKKGIFFGASVPLVVGRMTKQEKKFFLMA